MIYYRKDRDRYVVDVSTSRGRVRKQVKTEKEAQDLERSLTAPGPSRYSFVDAVREYQATRSKQKVTKETEKHFFYLMDIYFDERGLEFLDEIKPKHIEGLQSWLMEDHEFYSEHVRRHRALKPQSVNRYFSTYRNFFRWCVVNDMCAKNPCESVAQLSFEKTERALLTEGNVRAVFEVCPEWFAPCLKFIHLTGMPPSSVSELRWKDIRFKESRIVYKRRKGAQGKVQDKSFPLIMGELIELLTGHRERLIAKGVFLSPESHVFTNRNLSPISSERISKVANALFHRVGVKGTLYSMRHTLVDDLIRSGVGIEQAAQLVGHNDIRTTRNYTHPLSMAVLNAHLESVRGNDAFYGADVAPKKEGVS